MKEVVQYIKRNRGGHHNIKVGFLYASMAEDKNIKVGYSLCSKLDKFDAATGLCVAMGRAVKNPDNLLTSPPSIKIDICRFVERVSKYFRDAEGCFTKIPTVN